MNKRIIIDVDGTVCAMHDALVKLYNKDWNDNLTVNKMTDWYIHQFVKPECGKQIYDYFSNPQLYDMSKPIAGAYEAVNELRESQFHIIWATTTAKGSENRKFVWLKQNNFLDVADEYIETDKKFEIEAEYMIDDYWGNFTGFFGIPLMWEQPWNINHREGFTHFDSWYKVKTWILIHNAIFG